MRTRLVDSLQNNGLFLLLTKLKKSTSQSKSGRSEAVKSDWRDGNQDSTETTTIFQLTEEMFSRRRLVSPDWEALLRHQSGNHWTLDLALCWPCWLCYSRKRIFLPFSTHFALKNQANLIKTHLSSVGCEPRSLFSELHHQLLTHFGQLFFPPSLIGVET